MATNGSKDTRFQPGNKLSNGAPVGNTNSLKHGRYRKFSLSKLPKGCNWITTRVNTLRRELEAVTLAVHGTLGPKEEWTIQTVCYIEQGKLMAQRWLRLDADKLTPGERLSHLAFISSQSVLRDKHIDRLKLDIDTSNIGSIFGNSGSDWDDIGSDTPETTKGPAQGTQDA